MNRPTTSAKEDGRDKFTRTAEQPKRKPHAPNIGAEQSPDINSRLQKMEEMMEQLVQISTSKYQSKMPCLDDKENNKKAAELFFLRRYSKGLRL